MAKPLSLRVALPKGLDQLQRTRLQKRRQINQGESMKQKPKAKQDPSNADNRARFAHGQEVKIPIGDSTYQHCTFIGTDMHGVSTVKTKGGRYKTVWDCNLYPCNSASRHP